MWTLALKALGIFKPIKALFAWLFADARRWLTAALVITALWGLHERGKFQKLETIYEAHLVADVEAQKEAERLAKEDRERREAQFESEAENAQADYDTLRSKYNAAIRRLRTETGNGSPSPASGPAPDNPAPGDDGPRTGSGVFARVSQEDLLICAENTARLQVLHDLGDTWLADGRAKKLEIPEVDISADLAE